MFGLQLDALAIVLLVISGIASFFVGRHFRNKRQARRREQQRAAEHAAQSRQVRRARERRYRK